MTAITDIDLSWRSAAACRTADPSLFFAKGPGVNWTPGKAVCARCPARPGCAEHGVLHEAEGLWGGLTPQERHAERARRGIDVDRITYDIAAHTTVVAS